MILIEVKQDLFKVSKKYSLVHCISLDCKLGAGIAKEFRNKYPEMQNHLLEYIKTNHVNYPITAAYRFDLENRFIFNLITKDKYWNKPTYYALEECLKQLRQLCISYKIDKLAMPLIGCGLDNLEWFKVKSLIEKIFENDNIEIIVCRL